MGAGIAAMHYIGMEAMRLTAMCHYDTATCGSLGCPGNRDFVCGALACVPCARRKKGHRLAKNRQRRRHGSCHPGDALYRNGRGQFHADGEAPDLSHAVSIYGAGNGRHRDGHADGARACRSDLRCLIAATRLKPWNWNRRNNGID